MRYCVLAFVLVFSFLFETEAECAKKKPAKGNKAAAVGLTSENPNDISDAIQAIKKSKRPKDFAALEKRIAQGLPPEILLKAIDTLASSLTIKRIKTLADLASHRNVAVRKKIVQSLAKKSNPRSKKTLYRLLDDPSSEVRADAAIAIGNSALGPGMKHLKRAAERGLPEAAQIIGKKARAPEAKGLIKSMDKKNLGPLTPTYKILATRRDLPYKVKLSLIDKLVKIDSLESRNLLADLAKNLSKWDPLRLAAEKAYNEFAGVKKTANKKTAAKVKEDGRKKDLKKETPKPKTKPVKQEEKPEKKTAPAKEAPKPKTKPAKQEEKPEKKTAPAKEAPKPKTKPVKQEEKPEKKTAPTSKPKSAPAKDEKEQK